MAMRRSVAAAVRRSGADSGAPRRFKASRSSVAAVVEETSDPKVVKINGAIYTRDATALARQRKIFKQEMAALSKVKLAELRAEELAKRRAEEEARRRLLAAKVDRRKEHVRKRIVRVRRAEAAAAAQVAVAQEQRQEAAKRHQEKEAVRVARTRVLARAVQEDSAAWCDPETDIQDALFYEPGATTGYRTRFGAYLSRFETDVRTAKPVLLPIQSPEQVLEVRHMQAAGIFSDPNFGDGVLDERELADAVPPGLRARPRAIAEAPSELERKLEDIYAKYGHLEGDLEDMSPEELDALMLEMFEGMPEMLQSKSGEPVFPGIAASPAIEDGGGGGGTKATRSGDADADDRVDPRIPLWRQERSMYHTHYTHWDDENLLSELHILALDRILEKNPNRAGTNAASEAALAQAKDWLAYGVPKSAGPPDPTKGGWQSFDGPRNSRQIQAMLKDRKIQDRTGPLGSFDSLRRRDPEARGGRARSVTDFFTTPKTQRKSPILEETDHAEQETESGSLEGAKGRGQGSKKAAAPDSVDAMLEKLEKDADKRGPPGEGTGKKD